MHAVIHPSSGHNIVAKRDKFPKNTADVEWITKLGAEGDWCFISKDSQIRRSPSEKQALLRSGLTGFILSSSLEKMATIELTGRLLLRWPLIEQQARLVTGGALFQIPIRGARLRQLHL